MSQFDAHTGWPVVFAHGREEPDHRVARVAGFVRHQAVNVCARLVGEKISQRIEDDRVASVGGLVCLHRLQNVRMVADDHRGSGIQHLVRHFHVFGPRRCRVLCAPVNGDHQKITLAARFFDDVEHSGLVLSRRVTCLARIRKEVHMRLVVLIGIAVAVEPARHSQPAHLDSVGLGDDRLPTLLGRVARAGKKHSALAQVLARLGKARPSLVHHVIVGG